MAARPAEAGSATEVTQTVHDARNKLLALARIAQVTGDPAGPMLEALAAQLDAEHHLFDDLKRSLGEIRRQESAFTDKQIDDIGQRLLGACQAWSRTLVRGALVKSWALLAVTVLGAMLVGGGVSWLAFGRPLDTQCHDERGGRWCGYWLTQPTTK